jgi:hypothetical protein
MSLIINVGLLYKITSQTATNYQTKIIMMITMTLQAT